jgi:hypothetical protein
MSDFSADLTKVLTAEFKVSHPVNIEFMNTIDDRLHKQQLVAMETDDHSVCAIGTNLYSGPSAIRCSFYIKGADATHYLNERHNLENAREQFFNDIGLHGYYALVDNETLNLGRFKVGELRSALNKIKEDPAPAIKAMEGKISNLINGLTKVENAYGKEAVIVGKNIYVKEVKVDDIDNLTACKTSSPLYWTAKTIFGQNSSVADAACEISGTIQEGARFPTR